MDLGDSSKPTTPSTPALSPAKKLHYEKFLAAHKEKKTNNKNDKNLKNLVRLGIPPELRRDLWIEYSNGNLHKNSNKKNYYFELVSKNKNAKTQCTDDIDTDLPRTFVNNKPLQNETMRNRLRNVLVAFSFHNPELGYCQSISYIVEVLLVYMQEEESFYTLIAIIEDILPKDYFTTSMRGALFDLQVFKKVVEKKLPKINSQLKVFGADPLSPFCLKWFQTLFSTSLPLESVHRVFDVLFFEGNKILFRVALSIIKLNEDKLVKAKDLGELMMTIQEFDKKPIDIEVILKTGFSFKAFSKKGIKKFRDEAEIEWKKQNPDDPNNNSTKKEDDDYVIV